MKVKLVILHQKVDAVYKKKYQEIKVFLNTKTSELMLISVIVPASTMEFLTFPDILNILI